MARPRSIRVLVADDNSTVRRALRMQIGMLNGITVVAEASNGREAIDLARRERVDVVLMDLQMPEIDGLEATRELAGLESDGRIAVVVMTSHVNDAFVLQALDAGASGYLLKDHDGEQLNHAIQAAVRGEAVLSSRATAPVLKELARHRPSPEDLAFAASLTLAERRAVIALSSGLTSNEQIAEHLGLSVNTVRSQVQHAMRKVGAVDRTTLALWGARVRLDTRQT